MMGNSYGVAIFNSLSTGGNVLYISDFAKYLNDNKVVCTINQLVSIMSPYLERTERATLSEFEQYVEELN